MNVYCPAGCMPANPTTGVAAHENAPPGVTSLPPVAGAPPPNSTSAAAAPAASLPALAAQARALIPSLPPGFCSCVLEPPPGVGGSPAVATGPQCTTAGAPAGWVVHPVGCHIPPVALPHGLAAPPMAPVQVLSPPAPAPVGVAAGGGPAPIYGVPPIFKPPVPPPVQGGPIYPGAPIVASPGGRTMQPVVNVNGTTSVCCPCPA